MTPAALRKLAHEAMNAKSWDGWREGYLVDEPGEGWDRPKPVDDLIELAPEIAVICADFADELKALEHCSTAIPQLLNRLEGLRQP